MYNVPIEWVKLDALLQFDLSLYVPNATPRQAISTKFSPGFPFLPSASVFLFPFCYSFMAHWKTEPNQKRVKGILCEKKTDHVIKDHEPKEV